MANEDRFPPPPPPSLPQMAPWEAVQQLTKRLDRLITLFEARAPALGITVEAPTFPAPGAPTTIEVTAPWRAGEPIEIHRDNHRAAGTFYTAKLADFRNAKRLVLRVHSELDQDVQITVVGNLRNSRTGVVEKGLALPCVAKTDIEIGLSYDDWTCFVGAKIVITTAPTEGYLQIEVVVQE